MTVEAVPSEAVHVEASGPAHDQVPVEASAAEWLIRAVGVRKKYCRDLRRSLWHCMQDIVCALGLKTPAPAILREHEFWAVDDVSFDLRRGDSLAILGQNGAGKSTLLKMLTGQRSPSVGFIETRGHVVALTELGLGFNPVLTGRENAYVNAAVHGFSRRAFDKLIEQVIDFSGIRDFIDSAVQTYSSGMKARLGFSIATHLSPDILIVDEVLAVGDMDFKRKCILHLLAYVRQGGSMLLVAHEPYLIQSICNRCIVLEGGRVVFEGTATAGVNFHFHLGKQKQQNSLAGMRSSPDDDVDPIDEALSLGLPGLEPQRVPASSRERKPLTDEQQVIVDEILVLPESGDAVRTGTATRVVLRYRSSIEIEAIWGFTFCTADLQINIASCSRGMDGDTIHLQRGEHTLVCRLPELTLQAGVYTVRGGLADAVSQHGLAVLGYENAPGFFSVVAAEVTRAGNFNMGQNDLVTIKAEWLD